MTFFFLIILIPIFFQAAVLTASVKDGSMILSPHLEVIMNTLYVQPLAGYHEPTVRQALSWVALTHVASTIPTIHSRCVYPSGPLEYVE